MLSAPLSEGRIRRIKFITTYWTIVTEYADLLFWRENGLVKRAIATGALGTPSSTPPQQPIERRPRRLRPLGIQIHRAHRARDGLIVQAKTDRSTALALAADLSKAGRLARIMRSKRSNTCRTYISVHMSWLREVSALRPTTSRSEAGMRLQAHTRHAKHSRGYVTTKVKI